MSPLCTRYREVQAVLVRFSEGRVEAYIVRTAVVYCGFCIFHQEILPQYQRQQRYSHVYTHIIG